MEAQVKAQERRRLKRFSVRLKVYMQQTDELLGYAENLHHEGMMIVSKEPIAKNRELQIWFGASKQEKHLNRIFVSAYKVWESFTDSEERFYYSGLHFVAPTGETQDRILALLDEVAIK